MRKKECVPEPPMMPLRSSVLPCHHRRRRRYYDHDHHVKPPPRSYHGTSRSSAQPRLSLPLWPAVLERAEHPAGRAIGRG